MGIISIIAGAAAAYIGAYCGCAAYKDHIFDIEQKNISDDIKDIQKMKEDVEDE